MGPGLRKQDRASIFLGWCWVGRRTVRLEKTVVPAQAGTHFAFGNPLMGLDGSPPAWG